MSKFSDYVNNGEDSSTKNKSENINTSNDTRTSNYEEMISRYSKLSNAELMQEFMKLTIKEKEKGKLKDAELEGIKETLSPYLETDQKENLNQLIQMVKNVK